ncbi:hypothetical protein BDV41DRAFT_124236 [Aspergillus transmontanensis]|uniref:Uncharacterized protein n=1 Tax=Aspergillus transmontanensis TaxID=1034304 RepID=A0A5N6W7B5_9EURO|nr:hypothetical protein BDV41DRAFT_124236 [Aspergillus transmontanensis]
MSSIYFSFQLASAGGLAFRPMPSLFTFRSIYDPTSVVVFSHILYFSFLLPLLILIFA